MSKQTEIQWGEVSEVVMPVEEWKEYNLNEVYDFASGLSKPREEFGFGFGFLAFKDVFHNYFLPKKLSSLVNSTEKERKNGSIKRGDVFLTRTSETQEELGMSSVALVNYPDATFNGFTKRLRPKGIVEILPEFIGFYFRSPKFRATVTSMSSVTTRASLNNEMMSALKVLLPPLPEQRAIAAVLSSLDAKIDLLHRQNATLEALAETLFRQWFVEKAKEEWEEGKVGDLIEFTYGKALKDQDRTGSGFPVYGSNGVVGYHSQYLVKGPGIVTGRKGTLGVINYSFQNFFPIDTAFYITSKVNSIGLFFEYFLLPSPKLEDSNTDSAVPGLNRNIAHSMQIHIPPVEKIHDFNEQVEPYFRKTEVNQTQIQTLSTLRDTLLPKLMSGEVRVAY